MPPDTTAPPPPDSLLPLELDWEAILIFYSVCLVVSRPAEAPLFKLEAVARALSTILSVLSALGALSGLEFEVTKSKFSFRRFSLLLHNNNNLFKPDLNDEPKSNGPENR